MNRTQLGKPAGLTPMGGVGERAAALATDHRIEGGKNGVETQAPGA